MGDGTHGGKETRKAIGNLLIKVVMRVGPAIPAVTVLYLRPSRTLLLQMNVCNCPRRLQNIRLRSEHLASLPGAQHMHCGSRTGTENLQSLSQSQMRAELYGQANDVLTAIVTHCGWPQQNKFDLCSGSSTKCSCGAPE